MSPDLTPAQEAKFFETGELPADVTATPPTVDPVVAAPTIAPPTIAPSPSTDDPYSTLQRQLIDAEARRAATEQQLTDLVTQLQALQAQSAELEAPDPNTDPFGALQYQVANINSAIQNLQSSFVAQNDQAVQMAQLQQFVGKVHEMRDAFIQTAPDFPAAYQHIREVRMNDLRDAGVPEHMLSAALLQDEVTIAQSSLAAGRNPAAALYDMAKRHGYVARATQGASTTPPINSVLAAAQARLAQVQAGQAAAVNLPHGAAEVTFTPESLKNASEDDLNKIVQSNDLWNKVAGGRPQGKDIF